MTNPRTLLLSIAATACGFMLTLAGVAGPTPITPASLAASGLVSVEIPATGRSDPAPFAVALGPAASGPARCDRW